MSLSPVIVVGTGGHAVVVADALLSAGREVLGFVCADAAMTGNRVLGILVLGCDDALAAYDAHRVELANGIGGTGGASQWGLRRRVQLRLEAAGWRFATVLHPNAIVSRHASVDAGCQVLIGAIVQPYAHIGRGAIVNTRAVIEHGSLIGSFSHVGPGAVICGDVTLGPGVHVGAGATVRQGIKLGEGVVVGIGAAVVRDWDSGVLVGVPAKAKEANR